MIVNEINLDVSTKNMWSALASELDKLGYNIKVDSGRKGATVIEKESGARIGEVNRDMIEDEELDYILYSRFNLKRKTE